MKEYKVDTLVTLNIPITVEANNMKEAEEQAIKDAHSSYHFGESVAWVKADWIEKQ
tara:strand:- start:153 stop:320 length:168 start_codon:yes stop_codon:yes gene_type:complete